MIPLPPQAFCFRHGSVVGSLDTSVTEAGYQELELQRSALESRRFVPRAAVSSTERRCVQSVSSLWPQVPLVVLPELHAYGTFGYVQIVGSPHNPWEARDYAHFAFDLVIDQVEDAPFVLCSHDCMGILVGLALIERGGGDVDWSERNQPIALRMPDSGTGILVSGTSYEYLGF